MESFLEILKYTIPALVVFATAYVLLKMMLDDRLLQHQQQARAEATRVVTPIRLQAYERLMLLCDRVSVPNLLLRIRMPGMSAVTLKSALLLAIRQEFEHNTSQQVYVSQTLWGILSAAKEETLGLVLKAAADLDLQAPDEVMVQRLLAAVDAYEGADPLHKAAIAIRLEVGKLF